MNANSLIFFGLAIVKSSSVDLKIYIEKVQLRFYHSRTYQNRLQPVKYLKPLLRIKFLSNPNKFYKYPKSDIKRSSINSVMQEIRPKPRYNTIKIE
jgi:hypothetical protein